MFNSASVPISTPTTSTSTSTSTPAPAPATTPVETSVHNELAAETTAKTTESDSLTNGSLQEISESENLSIIDVDAPSTSCLQPVDHGKPPDVSSSTIPVEVVFDDFMNGQTTPPTCTAAIEPSPEHTNLASSYISGVQNLVHKICCGYINGAKSGAQHLLWLHQWQAKSAMTTYVECKICVQHFTI
ncbi:hypothetical protein V6N12_009393 [Hibiscus sabdariffa]|uniref:Uncharacterized protein n=1 Tax=Hibiscus sabdariffa TaxID=183260 RepID=A0ABR2E911_9ROSI